MTDNQLIQRTLHGEPDAFGVLVMRWERQIYGLALRVLSHEEDAKDICQETFLSAFRNLHKFRGEAQFSSWIYRIALNLCNTKLRRERSKPTFELDEEIEIPERWANPNVIDSHTAASREEVAGFVRRALKAIPPEMREVIVMKEYEGLKFEEIAEILKVPVSTVKTRLYTGLGQLRKRLEHLKDAL